MKGSFKYGIILISIGFFLLINPWFYIFSAIFILPGLYNIWFSNTNTKSKIKWTLIPFVCWIPLMIIFYQMFMKDKMWRDLKRLLVTAVTTYCSIFLAGTLSSRKKSILVEKSRFAFPQQDVAADRCETLAPELHETQ